MKLSFLYSKFFKKILRGKSIMNSCIDSTASLYSGSEFYNSTLGRHSYVGYDSEVHHCQIGAFCSIANHFIVGGAEHPMQWASTSPAFLSTKGGARVRFAKFDYNGTKKTVIGNDVWIGSRVIVKSGVKIGDGAIVGSGSVVTKDVPPYAIVVGCPAKIIKFRFDDNTIKALIESQWWELPDEEIKYVANYIRDPLIFVDKIKEINNRQ